MKKLSFLCTVALMTVGLSFSSCSDSDDPYLEVDDSNTFTGVNTDLRGGYFEIPIRTNGSFSVTSDNRWVQVLDSTGHGSGSVSVYVWPNYSQALRNGHVIIKSDNLTLNVPVKQESTIKGQTPDNALSLNFADVAVTKGVGYGLNLSDLTPKADPIINMEALKILINSKKTQTFAGLYKQSYISREDWEDAKLDSVVFKWDTLGVCLRLDIAYGLFHLNVKGAYHSAETKKDSAKIVRMSAHYPMVISTVAAGSIAKIAGKFNKDKEFIYKLYNIHDSTDQEVIDALQSLFNPWFLYDMDEICDLIDNSSSDTATCAQAVENMIDNWGAVITTGATLGGNITMRSMYDSIYMADTMNIRGRVDLAIKSGLFSLDAGIQAGYEKVASNFLSGSTTEGRILGGDINKATALYNAFSAKVSNRYDLLNEAKAAWVSSLVADDDPVKNNAEVLKFDFLPIWSFFGPKYSAIVKKYVIRYFKINHPELRTIIDDNRTVTIQ